MLLFFFHPSITGATFDSAVKMHGRVKVKSTAEQQVAKQKEREKKLNLYTSATQAALRKRDAGELDNEALEVTAQILTLNPDFASLWNLRREVFLHSGKSSVMKWLWCFESPETHDRNGNYTLNEENFLKRCVRISGMRRDRLQKLYEAPCEPIVVARAPPKPEWASAIRGVNCGVLAALAYSEAPECQYHLEISWEWSEEGVTLNKTGVSGYSTVENWQHLTDLYDRNQIRLGVTQRKEKYMKHCRFDTVWTAQFIAYAILMRKLELVQNAFLTLTQSDQSAWFYNRWLLGRADHPLSIRSILVSVEEPSVCVSFSQPVKVQDDLILFLDGRPLMVSWKTPEGKEKPSLLWVCNLPKERTKGLSAQCKFHVVFNDGEAEKECVLYPGQKQTWFCNSATEEHIFRFDLSEGKSNILQHELKSCKELQELEPENKWCLLTIILLMRALDPLFYEKECLSYFDILKAVDPMRSGYYDDLCSKFQMENAILKMEYAEARVIDLAKKVSLIYHTGILCLLSSVCA
ncbi:geranylgeranyl transferase type-2 subunit alpha [Pelobates cultripes]|uniref:Geranylgeranyl transferase type-2 subunit alpha n=1 Tax=Pelobates cultripes TaxID=61616 RepID=A0AAD1SA60_PELCU|nr:geranylgeranyl transferase type-2 subunit alpha [Pelobates cultripes]